jgi:hypothetical protein
MRSRMLFKEGAAYNTISIDNNYNISTSLLDGSIARTAISDIFLIF